MKKHVTFISLLALSFSYSQEMHQNDTVDTKEIAEVTLIKKNFKKESDRFVYDVARSHVAKGNTAFGILKATPMVSSTDDKTVKVLGKSNAVIFMNGRRTNMNAEAVVELLKNTPAENISKIEVITVPGSEYNVESSEAVINIVLKKKLDDGMNGNFRVTNHQDYYNQQSSAVSLNFRKDKLGISTNINGSNWQRRQYYKLQNGTAGYQNTSEGPVSDPNLNLGGYLNMDYALTDRQNIALSWNSWANRSYDSRGELFNSITTPAGINYNKTINNENSRSYNNSLNLNYELKTDSLGSKLNLNVAYLNYKRFQHNTNSTFESNTLRETLGLTNMFRQRAPQIIDNYAATADYLHKFKNELTLAAGGNFSKTETDNDTYFEQLNPLTGNYIKDENQSNHFLYREQISGAYLSAEKKIGEKFSGKLGVRWENTHSFGEILNSDVNIKRDYSNLLPFASFSYDINDQNNVSYSFSSRIRRPSFWELNPVRVYLTPTNYIQNNPFVKASEVYNHNFTYMLKQSYFFVVSHSLTRDDFSQIPLQKGDELRYIRTNYGDKVEFSATVGTQKSFFGSIFTTNTNVGLQINRVDAFLDHDPITGDQFSPFSINTHTNSLLIQTNNTIRLSPKKDWYLGVNYWYVGAQILNIGTLKPLSSLDVSIKKIWNDWTFNLEATDLLRTNVVKVDDTQGNGNYNFVTNDQFNRGVQFSVTYNFGNKKVKGLRKIEDASKDAKSRTR